MVNDTVLWEIDAHAAAAVVFVFLDMDLRSIQAVFQLPRLAIAIDEVADAGLGNAVPARLERPLVAGAVVSVISFPRRHRSFHTVRSASRDQVSALSSAPPSQGPHKSEPTDASLSFAPPGSAAAAVRASAPGSDSNSARCSPPSRR